MKPNDNSSYTVTAPDLFLSENGVNVLITSTDIELVNGIKLLFEKFISTSVIFNVQLTKSDPATMPWMWHVSRTCEYMVVDLDTCAWEDIMAALLKTKTPNHTVCQMSNPYCNFCGKNKHQTKKLLAGNDGTHICDGCVDLCHDILIKEKAKATAQPVAATRLKLPTPVELHEHLNRYVIGQTNAKKTLSVAVYNHYKRIKNTTQVKLQKNNVLIAGPTGTGKTLIAATLASYLDVPFVVTDATTITESGYAGDDSEVLIDKLLQAAEYDVEKAQLGIIYVDEIDKKAKRNDMVTLSRDVSGEGVQQSLLKLMEGVTITVPNKHGSQPEKVDIDTTNILFIVGGAFIGLDDIVKQRIGKGKIGFNEDQVKTIDNWEEHLQTPDLVKYGLIPEFVGRLPSVNVLHQLTKEELIRILTEPQDSIIDQIKVLFSLDKIEIEFNIKALEEIASIAIEQDLGARGLRKILDSALVETQYQLPQLRESGVSKIIITDKVITHGHTPLMVKG